MKCSQIQRGRRWGRGRIHVHNTRTDRQTDGKLDTHKPTQADAQADKAECALTDNHALRSHQFMFLSSLPHLPSLHFSLLSLICTSSSLTLHHLTYLLLLFTTPFLISPYLTLPLPTFHHFTHPSVLPRNLSVATFGLFNCYPANRNRTFRNSL